MGLSRHHATSVTLAVSMPTAAPQVLPPRAPSCSPGELALLLTKSVCPLTTTLFGEGGGGGGEGGAGGGGGGGGGGGVAMRASAVDTAISMVQCPGQPPRLLFSSRYLLPDGSAAAAGAFRVYPARQVRIDAFVGS